MKVRNFARRAVEFSLAATALIFLPLGCGGGDAIPITLTGTLDGARGPLAGFKLKCVTLTNPGTSGETAADANGAFTLSFVGGNVPFGCFVLNASDVQVASVFFTSSTNGVTGQTIKFQDVTSNWYTAPAATPLGTIAVNTARGTATATANGDVNNSVSDVECPLGVWVATVGVNSDCSGADTTATMWIGKDSAGAFVQSLALTPNKTGTCGLSAFAPTAGSVSYNSNDFILTWATDIGHPATVEAEVSQDCSQMAVSFTHTTCGGCGNQANLTTACTGSGVVTCPIPPALPSVFFFHKQ